MMSVQAVIDTVWFVCQSMGISFPHFVKNPWPMLFKAWQCYWGKLWSTLFMKNRGRHGKKYGSWFQKKRVCELIPRFINSTRFAWRVTFSSCVCGLWSIASSETKIVNNVWSSRTGGGIHMGHPHLSCTENRVCLNSIWVHRDWAPYTISRI